MRRLCVLLLVMVVALAGCVQTQKSIIKPTPTSTQTKWTPVMGQVGQGRMGRGRTLINSSGAINVQNLKEFVYSVKAGNLTETEKEDLMHMVEEEKLARDVYLTLYEKWKNRIFYNIAQSEQTHLDAVRLLIEKYNLSDPTEGKGIGEFTNPKFGELYKKLINEGSNSLEDALKVGAMIEELDIVDLKNCLNHTDKVDIRTVYQNLMKGSRNHLRAFVSQLKMLGVNYEPVYLSKEEFESIISSGMERGPTT